MQRWALKMAHSSASKLMLTIGAQQGLCTKGLNSSSPGFLVRFNLTAWYVDFKNVQAKREKEKHKAFCGIQPQKLHIITSAPFHWWRQSQRPNQNQGEGHRLHWIGTVIRSHDKESLWNGRYSYYHLWNIQSKSDGMRFWSSWKEESVYFASERDVNSYSQYSTLWL